MEFVRRRRRRRRRRRHTRHYSLRRQVVAEEAIVGGDERGAGVVSDVVHQADLQELVGEVAAVVDENVDGSTLRVVVGVLHVPL